MADGNYIDNEAVIKTEQLDTRNSADSLDELYNEYERLEGSKKLVDFCKEKGIDYDGIKDKMAGITSIVLTIPLFSYKKSEEKWQELDIIESFSATTISMVRQWRNDNLPESPNQLRKYKLAI